MRTPSQDWQQRELAHIADRRRAAACGIALCIMVSLAAWAIAIAGLHQLARAAWFGAATGSTF